MLGGAAELKTKAEQLADEIDELVASMAKERRKKEGARTRKFVILASEGRAHAATKVLDPVSAPSASASKSHSGEVTAQEAADKGLEEWKGPWRASDEDGASEILAAIEALEVAGANEIDIEPLEGKHILEASKVFRGNAGV